ncbi:hypothetical protein NC796_02965 [Aliifodinibius sp. S!AR15-10]|uniref:hypothetical protein n=1 Tax=Aliifodinibius sp. S!AR15-10 TaxID=2950437 RepID=UPI00285F8F55|nr:hypothetical protein [Aliifodinibius sp. S!AR15-10]MDR8390085.1 hypothetical protein [Aliifodinibius sp. S!AR15-10]
MIHKTLIALLLTVFFAASAGVSLLPSETSSSLQTINLRITTDNNNIWRVQDNEGKGKGTFKAKRADRINWLAMKSAMEFRFNKDVSNYLNFADGLFTDGKTQLVDANKRLRVSIKDTAPMDTLIYEVYVVEADTFVVGNSPPRLIISR